LASSSASRFLPQSGCSCRSAITGAATTGAVRYGCRGAWRANCSSPAYLAATKRGFH
jgi:hypothetical protein